MLTSHGKRLIKITYLEKEISNFMGILGKFFGVIQLQTAPMLDI